MDENENEKENEGTCPQCGNEEVSVSRVVAYGTETEYRSCDECGCQWDIQ